MQQRLFFSLGSIMAAMAVGFGAYAAHADATGAGRAMVWIAKAARYQMYHALALLAVSQAIVLRPGAAMLFCLSGWIFVIGITLFSGSLYLMAFTGVDAGYVTPAGGLSFMAGWLLMAIAAWRGNETGEK